MKDYNVMVNGQNFFDQPVKSVMKTYGNIQKIATGQGDDYTTGCLLDYPHFNEHFNLIPIDLSKQQPLDADTKVIEQMNFTGNQLQAEDATIFFIIEEAKEPFYMFHKELWEYCKFILL